MKNKSISIFILCFGTLLLTTDIVAQQQPVDSLQHYLNIAIENNPSIKSQHYAQEAFYHKIAQAGAFEDPELAVELYTTPMDIVGGRSVANISAMQMLPWFGTRKEARKEAEHTANAQRELYKETVHTLHLQVYTQWYALQKLEAQLSNTIENKKLLKQVEELALNKFAAPSLSGDNTASGGMSDVLRIGLEVVEVDNAIETLNSRIKAEKAKFNILLNREASSEVALSEIAKVDFIADDQTWLGTIEKHNPTLNMITEEGLAYKAKAEKDKKMSYPMIGLGLQYMVVGKTNDPMLAMGNMNGKDMIMPMVTVSLPIFRNKYKAQQDEAKLWWKSSEQKLAGTLNALKEEYYTYSSQLHDTERMITLYQKQTDIAETTYQLIIKEFISGKSDLTNVIQVQRQLLGYQLKKAEAIADYNTMVAAIQKLVAVQNNI